MVGVSGAVRVGFFWRDLRDGCSRFLLAAGLVFSAAATPVPAVLTYHGANDRAGAYTVPSLGLAAAARLRRDPGFDGRVPGRVFAQPLFWTSAAHPSGLLIVATEENHLLGLDPATGRAVWDRSFGPVVPGPALPCGNISPVGITGTPAIDASTGTVFFVSETSPGPRVHLHAVAADTGAERPSFPVDLAAGLPGFDPATQGQRGALLVSHGRVFVPFGGRSGDCGSYRGRIAAIDTVSARVVATWATRAEGGGIWALGGLSEGADGALFAATGNTNGTRVWLDGEAVLRLTPALAAADSFAPRDWLQLDENDLDLGGTTPVPFTLGGRALVLALGKDGHGYLLDAHRLGGIGGALASPRISADQIRTAPALWTENARAVVAFARRGADCPHDRRGLAAYAISLAPAPHIDTLWCAALAGAGAPVVTTTDGTRDRILWVIGADGDDRLHGFDADTGAVVFAGGGAAEHMADLHYTTTILPAAGKLYVGSDRQIYAFAPAPP